MNYQESLLPGPESIAAETARHEAELQARLSIERAHVRADKVIEDLQAVVMTIKMLHS